MNETSTEFTIAVPDEDLVDLQERLVRARWPRRWPEQPWAAGTDQQTLQRLADYWTAGFDWRAQEARLNAEPQRVVTLGRQRIHFRT